MASSSEPQETYDDFTRPGEEGFTGFPKHLPDDCVQYTIHVLNSSLSTRSALRSRLLEVRNAAVALQKSLLKDYIWQRESFDLAISPALDDATSVPAATDGGEAKLKDKEEEEMLHLRGKTSFGDSIADEWLIVYLLRELSLKFDDAWVRMWDADGEFLLVEAANALPKWMNPEVAEYRVWIHRGGLRIIPRYIVVSKHATSSNATSSTSSPSKSKVSQTPRVLTLPYALGYLERNTKPPALLHDSAIESETFHRIRNYPADIASSMHSSLISIPRNLAYVLHRCPTHINPAIEAFYLRDPIALKPLRDVSEGTRAEDSLYFPPRDLVDVAVKFTKVGFAQLRGQDFIAPKLWRTAVSDSSIGVKGRQRREMGMKLSCGFEMLLSDPANRDQRVVREIELLLEDLETGDEHLPTDADIETWGTKVDDEAWLDVNFEQFEKELAGRGKGKAVPSDAEAEAFSGFGDRAAQENLRRMVKKFEELLEEDEMGLGGDDSGDEMDNDDDSDTDDGEDDDGGQEAAYRGEFGDSFKPFDEEDFKSMMKDLGLPMETVGSSQSAAQRVSEVDSDDEPIDAESIKKAMADMEAELKELGVFDT